MINSPAQRNLSQSLLSCFALPFRTRLYMLAVLVWAGTTVSASAASFGEALYFSFSLAPNASLPSSPSSLLIQSPSYIDVPAGAVLSVHLMRGETVVASSTLTFEQAYLNPRLVPAMPVAAFIPVGVPPGGGSPLPNAILAPGQTDLTRVAMDTTQYRLLWMLSAGIMGTPGLAVATGGETASFVDLKLSAVSAATIIGDQKPGSVLFFNRYTSSASNSLREDSTLNLTNTNPAAPAYVRLFLVTAATCQPTEIQLCLAAQQTVSLLMSDVDPGIRGYAIAIATNLQGEPVQFNWLTGNAVLRQPATNITGSYNSVLSAVAIAKRKEGNVANVNGLAEMIFDDVTYDRLPGQIAFDSVPSQVGATNATILSIYRPLADLSGAVSSTSVQITGFGQNSQGQVIASTGNLSSACYSDVTLGAFRLQPTLINQLLPSGATAWFVASSNDLLPLLGAQFNSGEFNSGGNTRPLSFSAEYKIRIPVSPVTCPQS
jgi:hypothetical protein